MKKQETVPNFEEQWAHPETVNFGRETVQVYDIKPEHQKTPVPVVLAPGWAGTPEMYKENIQTLVGKNRRVISVNAPHGIDYNKEEIPQHEAVKIPEAEMRKIATLINTIKSRGVEKVDAIGHSQGCMDTVLAASLYPEYFQNIVLVNPAGMIGKDSLPRLMAGFSLDAIKGHIEELRKNGYSKPLKTVDNVMLDSIIKDPIQAFREVLAISDAQIHEFLIGLREKGVGVSIVSAVEDDAFPTERMQEIVTKDMVDGFYTVKGKHNQFIYDANVYTELAENALVGMNNRKHNQQ